MLFRSATASNGGSALQKFTIKLYSSSSINGTLVLNKTLTLTSSLLAFNSNITGLTSKTYYAVTVSATNAIGTSADSAMSTRIQVK